MACHLLVSPDPRKRVNALLDGRKGFYIKFGDGKLDSDFADFNPTYEVAENSKSTPGKKYKSTVKDGQQEFPTTDSVTLAKALEWQCLHQWQSNQSETEWHLIVDGPDRSVDQLGQLVDEAMKLFPNVVIPTNLDMSTASSETQEFLSVMEVIKGYKGK